MACAESVLEKLDKVDLAACLGEHVEILIVDMDVTVDMCLCDVLRQYVVVYEILCALGTVLEHGTHRSVAVDVGVLSLDVRILGVGVSELVVDVHQIGLSLSDLCVLSAVQDVCLCCLFPVILDEHRLDDILHLLDCAGLAIQLLYDLFREVSEVDTRHLLAVDCLVSSVYGVEDLRLIERHLLAVSLYNAFHILSPLFLFYCMYEKC